MKPVTTILIAALVAVITAYGTVKITSEQKPSVLKTATLFDRIQKTKTLRCAYITWSKSYFAKDPNTGKFEGIGYDMAMAVAKTLDVKIDWVEEVGVGTMYEGLQSRRYDAICTPVWLDATVAAHGLPTEAAYYSPVYAYARGDDERFQKDDPDAVAKINRPSIRLVDIDGSNGIEVHKNRYPNATLLPMPGTMSGAEIIQQVVQKKADITQQNPAFVEDFLKNNPGLLRRVTAKPLMVYPTALFILPKSEWDTKSWMDQAVISAKNIGTIDTILRRYDPKALLFIKPSEMY